MTEEKGRIKAFRPPEADRDFGGQRDRSGGAEGIERRERCWKGAALDQRSPPP